MTGELIGETIDQNRQLVIGILDDGMPEVNITYPEHEWLTNDGLFTMNGTAADLGSGLESIMVNDTDVWLTADGLEDWEVELNLTDGDYTLVAKATDIAGNVVTDEINITVDMTAPALTIEEPGMYVTTNEFDVSGTTEIGALVTVNGENATVDADGNYTLELNLTDGEHIITVVATDEAGNPATEVTTVIVDTVPPEVTADMEDGAYVNTLTVTFTGTTDTEMVTVNGANATVDIANLTYTIELTLVEGANNVTVVGKDLAGNEATIDMVVNVDTTPPGLTVTAPSGNETVYTNVVEHTLEGTVTGADTLMFNDADLTFTANGTFKTNFTLEAGENVLSVVAEDLAGNEATWTFTMVFDNVTPVVKIDAPVDGYVTNAATVTVKGTVDDLAATLVYGTNTSVTNDNGTFSQVVSLSLGDNTITIKATDMAGNVGQATVVVTYDNSVALTITTPAKLKKTVTKDTVTIAGTSEAGASIFINDVEIPVSTDGSFTYDLVVADGKNTVVIKAVDAAGNEDTETLTITREVPVEGMAMTSAIGLGIVLLIVGLLVGLVAGRMAAKPKGPEPRGFPEDEEEEEPTPEPDEEEDEESPFKSEEEEEEPDEEPEEKDEEPKEEPEEEEEDEDEKDEDSSLEGLLKDLDKK
jgi:hypothetical protein